MAISAATISRAHLPTWTLPLRRWQRSACKSWAEAEEQDALWVVTPGGGKSLGSARLSHAILDSGRATRVIATVPKSTLRDQFARAFARVGIQLDPNFTNANRTIAPGFHGVVATYQQVAANPGVFRDLTRNQPTLAILDEIHHASDESRWGESLYEAFEGADYRLQLSGSPFRSDGNSIPFIKYQNGVCVPSFLYPFAEAIEDKVCRRAVFQIVGGRSRWITHDGDYMEAGFDDKIAKSKRSERLRTYVDSPEFAEVLRHADATLNAIRASQPDAGGLVIAMDQDHAKKLANYLTIVTGEAPELVISEDVDAGRRITAYAKSSRKWVVAVHMISEGVDIPRLQVGVCATNVQTEMYFRQFLGRFVRMRHDATPGIEQQAVIYIPGDPVFVHYAKHVHEEATAGLKRRAEREQAALEQAEMLAAQRATRGESCYEGLGADVHTAMTLFGDIPTAQARPMPSVQPEPILLADVRKELSKRISVLVQQCVVKFNVTHEKVYATLKKRCKGSLSNASAEQMVQRELILQQWINGEYYDGLR